MSYQAAAERLGCLIGRTRWGHPLSGNKEMWMAPFVALSRIRWGHPLSGNKEMWMAPFVLSSTEILRFRRWAWICHLGPLSGASIG